MAAAKVIFLDRDGTINVDHEEWWKVERFEFHRRVPEALKLLKGKGYALALITNQGAVERGLYTEKDVIDLHEHVQRLLDESDAKLDVLVYCPHCSETNCSCRKPLPGMAKKVEEALGEIDYANSWMIGDKLADVGFGQALGTHTALIRSRFWKDDDLERTPDMIVDSLFEAADKIVSG